MMSTLEQLNSLLASKPGCAEAEVEIIYTLPSLHETQDDKRYFDRLEAIQFFPRAWPVGEC